GVANMETRGTYPKPAERQERVGAVGLRRPHRVEAEPLRVLDQRQVDAELRARVADVQSESHVSSSEPLEGGDGEWAPPPRAGPPVLPESDPAPPCHDALLLEQH